MTSMGLATKHFLNMRQVYFYLEGKPATHVFMGPSRFHDIAMELDFDEYILDPDKCRLFTVNVIISDVEEQDDLWFARYTDEV